MFESSLLLTIENLTKELTLQTTSYGDLERNNELIIDELIEKSASCDSEEADRLRSHYETGCVEQKRILNNMKQTLATLAELSESMTKKNTMELNSIRLVERMKVQEENSREGTGELQA